MTNQEKELFQVVPCNEFNTYWIPCTWFVYRIQEAAKKGKLLNDYAIETIMRVRTLFYLIDMWITVLLSSLYPGVILHITLL